MAGDKPAASAATALVTAVVAKGRTVYAPEPHGPGVEVLLEADEAERLAALGFVILDGSKVDEPVPQDGASVTTVSDGPTVSVTQG